MKFQKKHVFFENLHKFPQNCGKLQKNIYFICLNNINITCCLAYFPTHAEGLFCTNQFLKGIPPILILKISGHKTEKAFMRYLKIDEKVAAEKMMDLWKALDNK